MRLSKMLLAMVLIVDMVPHRAWAQELCKVARFLPVGCISPYSIELAAQATNNQQLASVGCVELAPGTQLNVVDRIGAKLRVSIVIPNQIVALWMSELSVECAKPGTQSTVLDLGSDHPPASKTKVPPGFEMTEDHYVWRNGRRLGWFDVASKVLFRPDQVSTSGSDITPKRGERGRKITSVFDWAMADIDSGSSNPPDFEIERTGDGYVWVDSQRIGWVDPSGPLYYRLDQLETTDVPHPRQGETGFTINGGDIKGTAIRAGKLVHN